ncbi:MAG: hypothetical protein ABSC94_04655 [Polyangiaceae bacterium]|jgi:hypothetical protein
MNANERIESATASSIKEAGPARRSPSGARGVHRAPPIVADEPVTAAQALKSVARTIASKPASSLAAALGIGFLVGGALSFRAGRIALGAASRRVARELLKQLL